MRLYTSGSRTGLGVWSIRGKERGGRQYHAQSQVVTLELQHAGPYNGLVSASNTCTTLKKLLIDASSDRP
jgi:hypothetical protein